MRRNLKKIVSIALMVVTVASTMLIAQAADATVSAWISSPAGMAGTTSSGTQPAKVYEAAETAHAQNCYAEFDKLSFGTLQSNFSNASRTVYVYLWDYDDGTNDDHVKTYLGNITNRKLTSISTITYSTNGYVEDAGDNSVELYIKTNVSRLSGDPSSPYIASGLFKFRVGIR